MALIFPLSKVPSKGVFFPLDKKVWELIIQVSEGSKTVMSALLPFFKFPIPIPKNLAGSAVSFLMRVVSLCTQLLLPRW